MVKLNLAITLDGYISRKDGSVDYIPDMGDKLTNTFNTFLDSIEVIILGRKSYDQMLTFGEYPFKDKETFVVTRKEIKEEDYINTYSGDLFELVNSIKGKNIWLFGGSNIVKQFIESQLIDEYIITILPVLLGEGIPLFQETTVESLLTLVDTEVIENVVTLTYRRNQ